MYRFAFALALAAGCAGTVGYTATGTVDSPDLVYVGPDVQVIADYDEPIFYSNNYYWRHDGNRWYRSHGYTGGWVYASPPAPIARIERPRAYVRYHPPGHVARRPHRDRDHRDRVYR